MKVEIAGTIAGVLAWLVGAPLAIVLFLVAALWALYLIRSAK